MIRHLNIQGNDSNTKMQNLLITRLTTVQTHTHKAVISLYGLSHICNQHELYSISVSASIPPLVN